MKKQKFTGKLSLNKETISKLQDTQMSSVQGGGSNNSTNNGFTCCWCTGGGGNQTFEPGSMCDQSTHDKTGPACPPDHTK
jgi:hypothetical protein